MIPFRNFTTLCAILLLAASTISGAGCARVLDPGPAPQRILLSPDMPRTDATPRPAAPVQLAVSLPETTRSLDTDHIAILQGRELSYLPNVRWGSHVPQMLQRHIIDALDAGTRIGTVSAESAGVFPDVRLMVDIQQFAARTEARETGVDIRLRLQMLDVRKGRIIASQNVEAYVPLADDRRATLLDGFEAALSGILEKTARWVELTVQQRN